MAETADKLDEALEARGLPKNIIGRQIQFFGFYQMKSCEHAIIQIRTICTLAIFNDTFLYLGGSGYRFSGNYEDYKGRKGWCFLKDGNGQQVVGQITVVD